MSQTYGDDTHTNPMSGSKESYSITLKLITKQRFVINDYFHYRLHFPGAQWAIYWSCFKGLYCSHVKKHSSSIQSLNTMHVVGVERNKSTVQASLETDLRNVSAKRSFRLFCVFTADVTMTLKVLPPFWGPSCDVANMAAARKQGESLGQVTDWTGGLSAEGARSQKLLSSIKLNSFLPYWFKATQQLGWNMNVDLIKERKVNPNRRQLK